MYVQLYPTKEVSNRRIICSLLRMQLGFNTISNNEKIILVLVLIFKLVLLFLLKPI